MAKTIPLTQGQVAIVDDEDFGWLSKFKWHSALAKNTQSFYAKRGVTTGLNQQRSLRMHNAIWVHNNGPISAGLTVDHADRDTLNNQLSNLRLATFSQQMINRRVFGSNHSGYRGVNWCKANQNWMARIHINGERLYLGGYATPEDAARAYDAAARTHRDPEFAQLNFPDEKSILTE